MSGTRQKKKQPGGARIPHHHEIGLSLSPED
jgi:hypothetical protein